MGAPTGLRIGPSTRSMQPLMMGLAHQEKIPVRVATLAQWLDVMQAKTTSALPA